jgi:hypothetical protein
MTNTCFAAAAAAECISIEAIGKKEKWRRACYSFWKEQENEL